MTTMAKSSCLESASPRREISTSRIATSKTLTRIPKQTKTDLLLHPTRGIKELKLIIRTVSKCSLKIIQRPQTPITDNQDWEKWDRKVQKLGSRAAPKEWWRLTGYNRVSPNSTIKYKVSQL
jgi:hypothetical protein